MDYCGGGGGNGKLRQWLIEQVDCGKYPGLVWENDEKSIFRIPWKHAGKQDYNRDEDAALFKAWALFKGKFREGIDKPDPPTWKTRLRCALNKSNDFEELVERSQLDISDPYKVYRIIPEGAKKRPRQDDGPLSPGGFQMHNPYNTGPTGPTQVSPYLPALPGPELSYYCQDPGGPLAELPFPPQCPCPPRSLPWQSPALENGYQLRASIYSYGPADTQPSPFLLDTSIRSAEALTDFRLHVLVYVGDTLVREVTTSSPEGCQVAPCPPEKPFLPPGSPELVPLPLDECPPSPPSPSSPPGPPSPLDRGVLLWMGADGLYARRLCQGRVYWQGGPGGPGKLEREVTCKLLHTQDYLAEIQSYGIHGRPPPRFQVQLSFGDESLDPQRTRRTLTVQVEPLVARQLLFYAQQTGGHFYRGYEHPGVAEHMGSSEDYQRALAHHHATGGLPETAARLDVTAAAAAALLARPRQEVVVGSRKWPVNQTLAELRRDDISTGGERKRKPRFPRRAGERVVLVLSSVTFCFHFHGKQTPRRHNNNSVVQKQENSSSLPTSLKNNSESTLKSTFEMVDDAEA
ncbi:interferon regulatory factor 4-like [Cololabis saira]|uniref:interferon regulatory factor 4-like n=1 Tax=Cololabis saira TaxID=129043 RepID=UPI002AD38ADE|nr:interferon regulatory factor 4-like [Cololabis saira]